MFGNDMNWLKLEKKLVKIKIIRKFRVLGGNGFVDENRIKLGKVILRRRGIWGVEGWGREFK